jgi:hypothetical protein
MTAPRRGLVTAPYNERGDLMDYVSTVDPHEWRDNTPFSAVMKLQGAERGYSAAHFIWHDEHGHRFTMFMTDITHLVQTANVHKGTVDSWWVACKRGRNYGVRLATADELSAAAHLGGNAEDCPPCATDYPGYPYLCPATVMS